MKNIKTKENLVGTTLVKNPIDNKSALIERLLAKAELDYKCCGSSCGHIAPEKPKR